TKAAAPTAKSTKPAATVSTTTAAHVAKKHAPQQSRPESGSASTPSRTASPKYRSQNGNHNKNENEDSNPHQPHARRRLPSRSGNSRLIIQSDARILRNHRGHAHSHQRDRPRIIPTTQQRHCFASEPA